jgi:FtsZ-binding cell division protein ZapB
MELNSLDKLEERISKAIAHIEKLTEVKSRLEEENEQLNSRISDLEKELKGKTAALERIEKQNTKVSEKVKEKVEGLLTKISNYEQSLS